MYNILQLLTKRICKQIQEKDHILINNHVFEGLE